MAKRAKQKRKAASKRTARQSGILAKRKGVTAERELVRACKEAGFTANRDDAITECTGKDTGWDVELVVEHIGPAYVQSKCRRRIAFLKEISASIAEAKVQTDSPMYVWQLRADGVEPMIVMTREDWFELLDLLQVYADHTKRLICEREVPKATS